MADKRGRTTLRARAAQVDAEILAEVMKDKTKDKPAKKVKAKKPKGKKAPTVEEVEEDPLTLSDGEETDPDTPDLESEKQVYSQ